MNCKFSRPITEDDISSLLDGEAGDVLRKHVAQCPACRARVDEAHAIEGRLRFNLSRRDCPAAADLTNYHFGLLAGAVRDRVTAHLKTCASCREELKALVDFLATDPDSDDLVVPAAEPVNVIRPYPGFFQAVPQAMAVRQARGKVKDKRQIRAVADGFELLFDVRPASKGYALEGLLVPPNTEDMSVWTGSLVEVRTNGELLNVCYVDELGTFRCEPVPPVTIQVRVVAPGGQSIAVSDLEISI